jgi:hypothetical protein
MPAKASLSILDQRRFARHRLEFKILGEHCARGDVWLKVANISPDGIMLSNRASLNRGDRVLIRWPVAGYLEAFCIWVAGERAGLQFERPIRLNEFSAILADLERRVEQASQQNEAVS